MCADTAKPAPGAGSNIATPVLITKRHNQAKSPAITIANDRACRPLRSNQALVGRAPAAPQPVRAGEIWTGVRVSTYVNRIRIDEVITAHRDGRWLALLARADGRQRTNRDQVDADVGDRDVRRPGLGVVVVRQAEQPA